MTDLGTEVTERFGAEARLVEEYGDRTVDVPRERWVEAVHWLRDDLGHTYFDWLTAVDELEAGFDVVLCCWRLPAGGASGAGLEPADGPPGASRLMLRTRVPRDVAALPSITGLYAGASWAERETAEMFGLDFPGHPNLTTLLLPEGFEGNPLRKEFVLVSRAARPWPGAKEPGESDADLAAAESGAGATDVRRPGPRRRTVPPGLPDPGWGPRELGEPPG